MVVVAAGSGSRLGLGVPKALVDVAGRSILEHALATIFTLEHPVDIVVVVPLAGLAETRASCLAIAGPAAAHLTVVSGGATRQLSVAAGLSALSAAIEIVLVHDAARAFTPANQFVVVAAAVEATGSGVVPALPVTDAIKRTDAAGAVLGSVDRSELVAVQTPQGFPRAELSAAYRAATADHPDDAALFAAAGHPVITVPGDPLAFKITTPWDLRRAESIAPAGPAAAPAAAATPAATPAAATPEGPAAAPTIRTGVGIDVHEFDPASELWLGGLHWPGEPGLSGHSDGDALCHAICDALLSASGLGDIGGRFGTADPRFAGAHGDVFVRATVELVTAAGFAVGNVAVQVVAKHPKLAARREELQSHLTALVGAPVSVSATTTDGLGFTGRGDGLAVVATALVHSTR